MKPTGRIETIVETSKGNIKIVQFNKPERKNAIDEKMYIRVINILKEAADDVNVSIVVLTGTGDYYSSGNDLKALIENLSVGNNKMISIIAEYINAFITFPKPLIAIVNGPAIGVAATTLALCDMVFATENSYFHTPFTKLGLVPEGSSTFTFPRLLGDRKAIEMLMFNHKLSAKEALECGFINYIYKPERVQNDVWDKITELSKLSQQALTASKRLIRRKVQDEMIEANKAEVEELYKVSTSEEYRNSVSKFYNRKSKI